MSELFTTTPPSEMGDYWICNDAGDESIAFRMVDSDENVTWCGFDLPLNDLGMIDRDYQFGPKVPSAKEYAELREKARKWDLLDSNFVDAGTGAICQYAKAIIEGTYAPVSYRISPEHLERLNSLPSGNIIDNSWDNPSGDIPRDLAAINEAFKKLIGRE